MLINFRKLYEYFNDYFFLFFNWYILPALVINFCFVLFFSALFILCYTQTLFKKMSVETDTRLFSCSLLIPFWSHRCCIERKGEKIKMAKKRKYGWLVKKKSAKISNRQILLVSKNLVTFCRLFFTDKVIRLRGSHTS